MYTITAFESAKELFDACRVERAVGDDLPTVPHTVYVLIDNGSVRLAGEGAERFELVDVTESELTKEAFHRAGIKVEFT